MSAWSDAVVATAPYCYYRVGEASGSTATDSSGNGRNGFMSGVLYSKPSLVPSDTANLAIEMDGVNDYVANFSGVSYSSINFSAMLIYKGTDPAGGFFATGSQNYVDLTGTNVSGVIDSTGVVLTPSYPSANISNGAAHLIIWVVKATTAELWVDGTMVASGAHTRPGTTRTSIYFKRPSASPLGIYDEMALWTKGLTSTEIASLQSAYAGGAPAVTAATSVPVASSATAAVAVTAATSVSVTSSATATAAVTADTSVPVQSEATAYEVGEAVPVTADTTVPITSSATAVPVLAVTADTTVTVDSSALVVPVVPVTADTTVAIDSTATAYDPAASMIPVDLSTYIDAGASATWDGTTLTGSPLYILFPGQILDPATTYTVEIDYTHNGSGFDGHASLHAVLDEAMNGSYAQLAIDEPLAGTSTTTLTIGPGLDDWDTSVGASLGEQYLVYQFYNLDITAIRVFPAMEGTIVGPPPLGTDTTNDAYKLTLGGWATATWDPAVVPTPTVLARHAVMRAIAYGPVTMDGTQPTFTTSEAYAPRLRQRILLGGRDITYDRDRRTPDVEYDLADLLLYGPATVELPQVSAAFEIGTPALDHTGEGKRVKVQLVDDATSTVAATVYKGFVLDPHVSGRTLTLEVGGEAQGRFALLDKQVPIFRDVLDLSRILWSDFRDAGIRYLPRLGEPGVGINSLTWGGMGLLSHAEEAIARMVKKDGTQRAVMPDDQGVYRITEKDTTTVHYSVFVDDTHTVPNLSSDITEKPNRIYATTITPSGMRVNFAAVPGLITTPAPDYPMAGGVEFGPGTVDADTLTGDGISVMVNRLGAVGLLDIRDTPGGYDEDAQDAVRALQKRAGLAYVEGYGVMTPAGWDALWDLDATGRNRRWSSIQPAAEADEVRPYDRAPSGAVIGLNSAYDRDIIRVDETIDMGSGFRERQAQNFAETRVHTPGAKVWFGTLTLTLGAVLAGQANVGATITAGDLVDARLVKPGDNLWLPNFDGGTLVHVSGVQVTEDAVTFTVDTRARPAREVWERLNVRRETRSDPARRWLGSRQSTRVKDAVQGFLSWGGMVDRNVPLVAGWNVVEVVVGDYGTIARLETVVQSIEGEGGSVVIAGQEYAVAVFGRQITAARLNALVPAPLTDAGERAWRRGATRKALRERDILYSAGSKLEPCGYGEDLKSDGATLTGQHIDGAGFRYVAADGAIVQVAIWVSSPSRLLRGRIMWPLLEGGV